MENDPSMAPLEVTSSGKAKRFQSWLADLGLVLLVWGIALALSVPFFLIARTRGAEMIEIVKQRDSQYNRIRAEASLSRGRLRYMEGKLDEAGFYLNQALSINPNLPDAFYYLGKIQQDKGDPASAARQFEAALLLMSNHYEARLELARILADQGQTHLALQSLVILEDMLPGDSELRERFQIHRILVPLAQDLLQENPNHPQSLLILAQDAVRRQNYDEADQIYQRILGLYPKNQAALWGLVEVSRQREDTLQQVDRLVNVVQSYPRWVPKYEQLQAQIERAGVLAGGVAVGLFQGLDQQRPERSFQGPSRSGMRLVGFDLLPRPTFLLNEHIVQLHWTQEQGLVWEAERARPIYRLQDNLYARQNRLFEIMENNLVPNSGFESSEAGKNFPTEWLGEYYRNRGLEEGWLLIVREDIASQRINHYIRLNSSALEEPSAVGLSSSRFEVSPNQTYLFGLRVRSLEGIPHIIFRWQDREEKNIHPARYQIPFQTNNWEIQHLVVKSPPEANLCNIVIANLSTTGMVDFDDLFLFRLEGID